MAENAQFLLAIGGFLLLGLAADAVGRRTFLPRVTLILLCGIGIGDQALGIVPTSVTARFDLIADMALMMVGFLLGGRLRLGSLREDGPQVLWISVAAALGAAGLVVAALLLAGAPRDLAILLGCIAAATAPAATLDTLLEHGSQGRFSRVLTAIVAIDDAWALVLFSLGLALVALLNGESHLLDSLAGAAYETGGALLLGGVLGLPAAALTGRIRPGQPMLMEALGLVLVCGGLAIWLEVSYLIATMTAGAIITNLARHHDYPFHEIENIEWPFMVVFFMLAGATLEFEALEALGIVTMAYVMARVGGKLLGASVGAGVSRATPAVRRWMGLALLPQAGVAIGMALLASSRYPEYQETILTVIISSTVLFELIGPVATRYALTRADAVEREGRAGR